MAVYSSKPIQDVSTGHIRPVVDPVDNTTANTISGLGGLAVEGYKQYKTNEFQEEVDTLKEGYMAEEPWYSAQEVAAVEDFKKRVKMFEVGANQANRQGEFKTRAEALLKERSTALPGLSDEFRRIASDTLGFDPTGYSIKDRMAKESAGAGDHKAMLKEYEELSKSYGMLPDEIYRPGGPEKFQTYAAVHRRINDLELLKSLKDAEGGLSEAIDIPRQLMTLTPDYTDMNAQAAYGAINETIEAATGMRIDGRTELEANVLSKIPEDQVRMTVANLQDQKDNVINGLMKYRADFKNAEQWNDYIGQITAPFDRAIEAMSSEEAFSRFQSSEKLRGAAYANGLKGTPAYESMLALQAAGFPLDNLTESRLHVDLMGQITGKLASDFNKGGNHPDPRKVGLEKGFDAAGKDLLRNVEGITGENPEVENAVLNYADILANSDRMGYNVDATDALVKTLGDQKAAAYFKEIMSKNPELAAHVEDAMFTHANKAAMALANRLEESRVRERHGGTTPPRFNLVFEGGEFRLENNTGFAKGRKEASLRNPNSTSLLTYRTAPGKLNELTRTWVGPMNNAAKAAQSLYGVTPEEFAQDILQGTGFESLLPDPVPDGEAIEKKSEVIRSDKKASIEADARAVESGSMSKDDFIAKHLSGGAADIRAVLNMFDISPPKGEPMPKRKYDDYIIDELEADPEIKALGLTREQLLETLNGGT